MSTSGKQYSSDSLDEGRHGGCPQRQRQRLLIMVGLPGSGKTTIAKEIVRQAASKGRTWLRVSQDVHKRVDKVRKVASTALQKGKDGVIIDRTNLTRQQRAQWAKMASLHNIQAELIIINLDRNVCLARCRARRDHEGDLSAANAAFVIKKFSQSAEWPTKCAIVSPSPTTATFPTDTEGFCHAFEASGNAAQQIVPGLVAKLILSLSSTSSSCSSPGNNTSSEHGGVSSNQFSSSAPDNAGVPVVVAAGQKRRRNSSTDSKSPSISASSIVTTIGGASGVCTTATTATTNFNTTNPGAADKSSGICYLALWMVPGADSPLVKRLPENAVASSSTLQSPHHVSLCRFFACNTRDVEHIASAAHGAVVHAFSTYGPWQPELGQLVTRPGKQHCARDALLAYRIESMAALAVAQHFAMSLNAANLRSSPSKPPVLVVPKTTLGLNLIHGVDDFTERATDAISRLEGFATSATDSKSSSDCGGSRGGGGGDDISTSSSSKVVLNGDWSISLVRAASGSGTTVSPHHLTLRSWSLQKNPDLCLI